VDSQGHDLCAQAGWYGDGTCDDFCPSPDPDCAQNSPECQTVADCPPTGGAACATVCADGSNPCGNACVSGQCVERGCPDDHDGGSADAGSNGQDGGAADVQSGQDALDAGAFCSVDADCPPNPGASCAHVCADGTNPCGNVCVGNQCVMRGCPNDVDGGLDGGSSDAGGSDAGSSDGGSCQPNGGQCSVPGDCCSGNCITRVSPGYCCEPGGCP
jgi:hypothetical protein